MNGNKRKFGCGTYILIWAASAIIVTIFLKLLYSIANKTDQDTAGIILVAVIWGFVIAFVVYVFILMIIGFDIQYAARKQMEDDRARGITRYSSVVHVEGLRFPANCDCSIELTSTELSVLCAGIKFVTKIDQILNVELQVETIEKQYLQSSVAKGIVGGAVFGVPGAISGSSPKVKTIWQNIGAAVITYRNVNGVCEIFVLKDKEPCSRQCEKLVNAIKTRMNAC